MPPKRGRGRGRGAPPSWPDQNPSSESSYGSAQSSRSRGRNPFFSQVPHDRQSQYVDPERSYESIQPSRGWDRRPFFSQVPHDRQSQYVDPERSYESIQPSRGRDRRPFYSQVPPDRQSQNVASLEPSMRNLRLYEDRSEQDIPFQQPRAPTRTRQHTDYKKDTSAKQSSRDRVGYGFSQPKSFPNKRSQNITPKERDYESDQISRDHGLCDIPSQQLRTLPQKSYQKGQLRKNRVDNISDDLQSPQQRPGCGEEPFEDKPPPSTSATSRQKGKLRTVHPEEIGIEVKQTSAVTPAFVGRPGFGRLGKPIKLISNCFPIEIPSGNVYHYDVEVIKLIANRESEVADNSKRYRCLNTKTKRKVVALMLENNQEFNRLYAAFDGEKNLYTRKELHTDFPLVCEVILPDEYSDNPDDPRGPRQDTFKVEIKPVKKNNTTSCAISLDSIHALFEKKTTTVPEEAIMAVETVLRHGPCLRFTPIGRSFYFPPNPGQLNPLGGGLEIWFGYHQSIRLGQWKPTVNLDIAATTFFHQGPILKYIADFIDTTVDGLRQMPFLNNMVIRKVSGKLQNKQIKVTHLRYPRKYRIVKLTRESANQMSTDITSNGVTERKTVARYFKDTHGRTLQFPHLPCLQVQPKEKNIYLPIEFCELIPGQHYKGELSLLQKSKMLEFTSKPPKVRFEKIDNIVQKANFNNDRCVQEFDFNVSPVPLSLEARVLNSPKLVYEDEVRPRDGSWNVRDTKFLQGAEIPRWALLSFGRVRGVDRFAENVVKIGRNFGMKIDRPVTIESIHNLKNSLKNVKKKADLAIIVIPTESDYLYADIKKEAETVIGLTTQCLKEKTLEATMGRGGMTIVSNLCLKINVKMGGENNSLVIHEIPRILSKPVIIIGADVNHPAPTDQNSPSLAACVGSLDSICKRCAVSIRAQVNKDSQKKSVEIIGQLEEMVKELLVAFHRRTRQKPEKIIFYRDGVSEGDFAKVKQHEVVSIRKACQSLEKDYEPGITFIVVQKRHHVRFRPDDPRDARRNIPSGTVVDTEVTHPVNFDFFLCSQHGPLGTSRPSHYTVIEDDNEFSADDLQKMTFQLCHMYARCTKSISIPAPVAYAHLVAYRARKHLAAEKNEDTVSSSGSGLDYRLTQEDIDAIKIIDDLKSSMYFV